MGQQKRDLQPVTVYLPPDLIAALEKMAAVSRDSVSAIIRRELMKPRVEGRDRSARAD